jgi:glycosyltransferase involved in cell wall biosynthesis
MREVKIAIVSRSEVADVSLSSGYPHFMARALQAHVGEVIYLSPDKSFATIGIEKGGRIADRFIFPVLGRHISADHHRILAKRLAHVFGSRLSRSGCNAIFAPNAGVEIASLATNIPVVLSSDLTWANMIDYYPGSSSMFAFAQKEGDRIEAAAIRRANALLYPSAWAAQTAIEHYGAKPENVHCISWGANFDAVELPSREEALQHPLGNELQLLWTGVDWERKGGPIAYECLFSLLERGVAARLVVCGCVPPARYQHQQIEVVPFLNKRDPVQRQKLSQLFLKANFFIFPTIAEAFGIVLCEASAHGLPSLVRNTGGVGGAVTDGVNGYLLPAEANGKNYAEKILEVIQDRMRYGELVRRSRRAYEERLNWDAWGRAVRPIFERLVRENSQA